jgi:NADH pyrophosphatase NudC (nudix superfamily)
MIGCVAQAAAGQDLRVDPDEMEDVRCADVAVPF